MQRLLFPLRQEILKEVNSNYKRKYGHFIAQSSVLEKEPIWSLLICEDMPSQQLLKLLSQVCSVYLLSFIYILQFWSNFLFRVIYIVFKMFWNQSSIEINHYVQRRYDLKRSALAPLFIDLHRSRLPRLYGLKNYNNGILSLNLI